MLTGKPSIDFSNRPFARPGVGKGANRETILLQLVVDRPFWNPYVFGKFCQVKDFLSHFSAVGSVPARYGTDPPGPASKKCNKVH